MKEEVNKIRININQKINLGGYETRDYSLGVDIEGFNPKSKEEIQNAIDFGRELCLKDVSDYYKKVKQKLQEGEEIKENINKDLLSLEKKINSSENEEQLRTLEEKINGIDNDAMQKIMQRKFNLKLMSLKEK